MPILSRSLSLSQLLAFFPGDRTPFAKKGERSHRVKAATEEPGTIVPLPAYVRAEAEMVRAIADLERSEADKVRARAAMVSAYAKVIGALGASAVALLKLAGC